MIDLLDTNVCIHWLRYNPPRLVNRIKQQKPDEIVLCSMVVAELLYGVERSSEKYRQQTARQVENFRRQFVSLPFDDQAAEEYGKIRELLTTRGTPIGGNDLLIAAIAISNNLTLVTHNASEFSRLPNLKVEDWQFFDNWHG